MHTLWTAPMTMKMVSKCFAWVYFLPFKIKWSFTWEIKWWKQPSQFFLNQNKAICNRMNL
jgi:hypothetical protein